jgi:hypothetical protein
MRKGRHVYDDTASPDPGRCLLRMETTNALGPGLGADRLAGYDVTVADCSRDYFAAAALSTRDWLLVTKGWFEPVMFGVDMFAGACRQ